MDVTSSCKSPINTGVQRVVRGIFRSMMAGGVPVTPLAWEPRLQSYCTLSGRERRFLEAPFSDRKSRKARAEPGRLANMVPIWSRWWRQVRRRRQCYDLLSRLTKADVLFVPEIFQDNRVTWLPGLGSRTGARRVAVFHDAIAWRRPDITPPARKERFVEYMQALASFDTVLAVSAEAANDLQACWETQGLSGEVSRRILISGWPVDDHFTAVRPAVEHSASGSPNERRKIVCVGTFEPRKNHLALLNAAEQLWQDLGPVFDLILIGRSTGYFGEEVVAEINRLRKAGWPLDWWRHVDDETLRAAYQECFFTVFPSFLEGFGLPIVESLSLGRPCICGGNGALGEVARGGGCLIVDQTDVPQLTEAMRRLLTNEQLYTRLSAEARARQFETWAEYLVRHRTVLMGGAAA